MNRWTATLGAVLLLIATTASPVAIAQASGAATPQPTLSPTSSPTPKSTLSPKPKPTVRMPSAKVSPSPTRPRFSYVPPDLRAERAKKQAAAERYFDLVAERLGAPGVWVDPEVTVLTTAETSRLEDLAKAAAPIRIAIIPAKAIDTSPTSFGSGSQLAWEGEEIADQLYDRVGVEGVYAVLVDASSQRAGRGLHAVQRADHGPDVLRG